MCCCAHPQVVAELGFYVCVKCGVQQHRSVYIKPCVFGRAPSRPPYSRKKRFVKLLFNTWAARLPRVSFEFMKYIYEQRPRNPTDIVHLIRDNKTRSFKRYDCLAKLSHELLKHEILPLSQEKISFCLGIFQKIEIRHRELGGVFPAYSFILEKCFEHPFVNRIDLIKYLHLLKCVRRRCRYSNDYRDCFTRRSFEPTSLPRTDLRSLGHQIGGRFLQGIQAVSL